MHAIRETHNLEKRESLLKSHKKELPDANHRATLLNCLLRTKRQQDYFLSGGATYQYEFSGIIAPSKILRPINTSISGVMYLINPSGTWSP